MIRSFSRDRLRQARNLKPRCPSYKACQFYSVSLYVMSNKITRGGHKFYASGQVQCGRFGREAL